jgi:hypothetical protein
MSVDRRFLLGYEGRVNFSIVTETPSLNMHNLLVSSKRGKKLSFNPA